MTAIVGAGPPRGEGLAWGSGEQPPEPALVTRVHRRVGEALAEIHAERDRGKQGRLPLDDERAMAREQIAAELRRLEAQSLADGGAPLDDRMGARVTQAVLDRLHGLARIEPLLRDPEIRDIHISGHNRVWLTMRNGTKVPGPAVAESDEDLVELIATAARRLGRSERRWDYANPELNLQLPSGDRLHALMAVSGRPAVTIRRHDWEISRLDQLVDLGLCDELLARFLAAAVRSRRNVIVAGGTGTGKTTTLRALINEIDPTERVITIEDSLEIGLDRFEDQHPDHEMLEARGANTEGAGAITLADLVTSALRMDPDRVIVGEVRGAEVLPMLLAMSQGGDGSMCSIHADSSKGVFSRFAMYAAMTRERLSPGTTNLLVANAVDIIVHLAWVGGTRQVTSVREVTGAVEGEVVVSNELWRPGSDGAAVPAAPPTADLAKALAAEGFDFRDHAAADGYWREA